MIRTFWIVTVSVLTLTSCNQPESRQLDSSPIVKTDSSTTDRKAFVVDASGAGRVRTGVTLAQLSATLGEPLKAGYRDNETCDYVKPSSVPAGVSLMVISDTVARIDVTKPGIRTVEGASVGDTEAEVLGLYKGLIHVEPHKYTGPEGHYLIVTPPSDTLHRIIFETDGKVVTLYRAGRLPAVGYIEGCS